MHTISWSLASRLLGAVVLGGCLVASCAAQLPDPQFGINGNLSLPIAPGLTSALIVAEQAIKAEEWDRAVSILQLVVDADEDGFISPDDARSLQQRAVEMIGELPPAGRQLYERLHNPAAEALLEAADQQGDRERLNELVRRYFHTPSGRAAAWRLGKSRQDQGASLSAALLFEKLLAAPDGSQQFGDELRIRAAAAWLASGAEDKARLHLDALAAQGPRDLKLFGQEIPAPVDGALTPGWLRQLFGDATSEAGRPSGDAELIRWPPFLPPTDVPIWSTAPICTDDILANYPDRAAELNSQLAALERDQRALAEESGRVLIPAPQPYVVGDRVLFRGPDRLTALAAIDGSLLWTGTPVDFTYRELTEKTEFPERELMTRELFLGQRAWRDETSASISCDGTLVYTVMDCGMIGVVDAHNAFQTGRHGKGAFRDNSLQAYALSGGKQRWSIGGPVTPAADPFAGMFFLGPPLPHEGKLYCLVEERGQVRLLALDPNAPDGPDPHWSQALLNPSFGLDIELHEPRRTTALQPVAKGQVLICPTGAGSIVAVDLVEQRLLWAAAYDEPAANMPRLPRRPPRAPQSQTERQQIALDRLLDAARWRQGAPLWVDDYVLVTTPDADNLACVRASNGELLWDIPREDWLYIAAGADQQIVLVGETSISAVRLSDGRESWVSRLPIPAPCGRGFEHDGRYTLPLITGELITIDLHSGQLLARSPIPEGVLPGNILAVEGGLLSQSASGVSRFRPLSGTDDWRTALQDPASADPQVLALAGESLLHAGETERGIAALRTALQSRDDLRSRLVLGSVLTEQLRIDFAAHRGLAAEAERLLTGTRAELNFRRLMATQSQGHGHLREAFRHLFLLGTLAEESLPLESVTDDLSVALDRWVAGRIGELIAHADTLDRKAMLDQLQLEIGTLTKTDTPDALERLQRIAILIRGTPLETEAALALARRSTAADPAAHMRRWLDVLETEHPAARAEATAQLAQLCLDCGDPNLAAPYVSELRTTLADQPVLDGRTGSEQLARWGADPKLGQVLAQVPATDWPSGELRIRAQPIAGNEKFFHVLTVKGPVRGPLAGWTFTYDDQQQQIAAYTPLGVFAWETPVDVTARQHQSIPQAVMIDGPLVAIYWPDRVQIISAIVSQVGRFRPVRLTRSHVSSTDEQSAFFGQRGRIDSAGVTGPLTRDLLCYQQGSTLIGFDPWTDRDVWRRSQPGGVSEILGDAEFVVVRPSARGDLLVLRALDGTLIATRPQLNDPLTPPDGTDWGRQLLTLDSIDDNSDRLAMYDSVTDKPAWERTLKSPVYWNTVDGGTLLVIDGDLQCTGLEPSTGRELFRVELPIEPPAERLLRSFTTLSDSRRIYFVLNDPPDSNQVQFQQQRAVGSTVNGKLCALDRATRQLAWTSDVAGQYVDPQQPAGWPVLVLASRQKKPDEGLFSSVQAVVDKATGELLFEDRQVIEGLSADFRRRASWKVFGDGPSIRVANDLRAVVIEPGGQTEPAP